MRKRLFLVVLVGVVFLLLSACKTPPLQGERIPARGPFPEKSVEATTAGQEAAASWKKGDLAKYAGASEPTDE